MSQVPILLWGGPNDGEEMVLSEDEPDVRVAVLDDPVDMRATPEADPASAAVSVSILRYQRTDWVKASGHRVYKYAPYKKP